MTWNAIDIGNVGSQPTFHQSIIIGNPTGNYVTYTYSVSNSAFDEVYPEPLQGGAIKQYLVAPQAQDSIALAELLAAIPDCDQYFYGQKICRTFA